MPNAIASIHYTLEQVAGWFDARVVTLGRGCVDAVAKLEWRGATLCGKVRGAGRMLNETEVAFETRADGVLRVHCTCTCTAVAGCEHAAALLMRELERKPKGAGHVRPEVLRWIQTFRHQLDAPRPPAERAAAPAPVFRLVYVIGDPNSLAHAGMGSGVGTVNLFKARLNANGTLGALDQRWDSVELALVNPPKFLLDEDLAIMRTLLMDRTRARRGLELAGESGAEALAQMLATGRAMTDSGGTIRPLRAGASRLGRIAWLSERDERLRPLLQTEPASTRVLATQPPWFIDANASADADADADADAAEPFAIAGPIDLPWPAAQLETYLRMPALTQDEAALIGTVLRETACALPPPPAMNSPAVRVIDTAPVPVLTLGTLPVYAVGSAHAVHAVHAVHANHAANAPGAHGCADAHRASALDYATLHFDYDGVELGTGDDASLIACGPGGFVHVKRREMLERAHLDALSAAGLARIPAARAYGPEPFPSPVFGFDTAPAWDAFVAGALPVLRANGWRVRMTPAFRLNVIEITEIEGTVIQAGDGWFDIDMGINVSGRRVKLGPLLVNLLRGDRRWLVALDQIGDDEPVELITERAERMVLRAHRLKPVVRVLIDLFDDLGAATLRVSRLEAGRVEALLETGRWEYHGDTAIRQLAQSLQGGGGLAAAPVPRGLHADLRAYQQHGLNWMQFLREHGLNGVLADDMGLGKTVQTLAHILCEREAGRLDRPVLIVVPTTLVHNWRDEARRFAPSLRVLDLHGPDRQARFAEIPAHDIVLTTYPLVWRDAADLAAFPFHLLILDEAQYVKNANTKAGAAIRGLSARHRLCLTGTPLENHLGELWSQFDFLLPGFLGSQKDFARRWRTPIEKAGDTVRRDLLARRIRPFMLRRLKDEVACDLPPKTLIVRNVQLEGGQRDFYESVRATMQDKVRAAIAAQGLARSRIVVLDALLKLRQVCCDPALVKLPRAAKVKESAKLEMLLEMLPDLIEEGRRVLVFSQFTGMLKLIADALDTVGIAYVTLTGDTVDRHVPVARFQHGEVPLFLISLKAGGVGLNLTAADTVIHYDPWWNPAAENQATDRAHRLGQDKPVFVYKLIAAGSIEERIVAMQERKAALAGGILSGDPLSAKKFSTDDIEALFEPMPPV